MLESGIDVDVDYIVKHLFLRYDDCTVYDEAAIIKSVTATIYLFVSLSRKQIY